MNKIEEIQLSPIEATTYWWTNSIRNKVREIAIHGARDSHEVEFANIFYEYTEIDWRNLYLKLVTYISKDIENYISNSLNIIDAFSQDTAINGHDRLNEEIAEIIDQSIPNIRLAGNGVKDSVIYTTDCFASVWYKSCGITKLTTQYEPSYVLTGDDEKLNFYNLLISTIMVLEQKNNSFDSLVILRERFCKEYIRLSDFKENIEDVIGLFNFMFNRACQKGIILGRAYKEKYYPSFHDIDFVGLDSYITLANQYASVVLQKSKDDAIGFCKKKS